MYLQGMKQVYPPVEKVLASSFSSRGLFFSSIWTVQPRSDCPALAYGLGQTTVRPWLAVQILENESSLSANQFRLFDSPLLSNYFPAAWNYYSLVMHYYENKKMPNQGKVQNKLLFGSIMKIVWHLFAVLELKDRSLNLFQNSISLILNKDMDYFGNFQE